MFHLFPEPAPEPGLCPVMRPLAAALFALSLALPGWNAVHAEPGMEAERISSASALDSGYGAVVISIRSALFLEDPLDVYFLREGGSVTNESDVVRFERKQGTFSLGNDTTSYKIRAFQLRPGTYRLIAHGVTCPKIPAENERCLVDWTGITGTEEISRPSRGYPEIAPTFEVRAGAVTYAGDFALTGENKIEWSEIPHEEMRRIARRFERLPRAPDPIIPGEYRLKYGLFPRSFEDDYNRRY